MENYFINKILLILLSISVFAFGLHFYSVLPNIWLATTIIIGYSGIGLIAWLNERKYRKEKSDYMKRINQNKK